MLRNQRFCLISELFITLKETPYLLVVTALPISGLSSAYLLLMDAQHTPAFFPQVSQGAACEACPTFR